MSQGPESQGSPSPPAGETSPSQTPVPSPAREGGARLFSNAFLMIFGAALAAGGWFLARVYAPPQPPGEVAGPSADAVDPKDFKALASRVDAIQAKADDAVKKSGDGPELTSDFRKLRDQVDELSRNLANIPPRFDQVDKKIDAETKAVAVAPSPRLDGIEKRLADLTQEIELLKTDVKGRLAVASPPPPSPETRAIERGVELFKQGKYAEADAAFEKLRATSADDARVWYYSALARGLSTREWLGETERLVIGGLEREKVGSPPTAEIDTTFAGLTTATGKEWLAAYRKRIAAR